MPEKTKTLPSWFEEKHGAAGSAGKRESERTPGGDPSSRQKPEITADGKIRIEREPGLAGNLRADRAPLVLIAVALTVLCAFFWFVFVRDPIGETESKEVVQANPERGVEPFSSGEIRDSGVAFGGLEVKDGEATLKGAGLEWIGTVSEKEGGGETVTLEGPTAAQMERGFDLGSSSIETGVYAIAQQSGEVLHVSTHTLETSEESGEITLGTVYALDEGDLSGYAYYLDERDGSPGQITRTYVIPGKESYRVTFGAEPGTFVPLLVGWRGFEKGAKQ